MTADVIALNGDVLDLFLIDVVEKIRKREGLLWSAAGGGLEQIEECDEKQPDNNPKGEVLAEIIHDERLSYRAGHRAPITLPLPGHACEQFSPDLQIRRGGT